MAKDISKSKSSSIASVPSFLQTDKPAGNENVTSDDMQLPRLKLTQTLSPELDTGSASYIEGATAGQIINTVTHTAVDSMNVVNIYYKREFAVYQKREAGSGGFQGAFETESAALDHIRSIGGSPDQYVVKETGKHLLLILDDDGNPQMEAMCLMDGSKIQTSNSWNTSIAMIKGVDRFASVWNLSTVRQSNSKGSWHNYAVDFVGYVDEELYGYSKNLYERVAPASAPSAKAA
jgi:hypothetical protein